ncbi:MULTISPECIES: GDSL-type esterase/lipase family protein [Kordiimonas]|jgi:lysophospholipase L1-like esterase|uniref:GDSL-type esterase/lipase family protein n=1 Tax=Kordiimonas TaxID=288021 RepID=UPI00257B3ADD|nr:GDSL-type esterase/lipase family protein [Kordiimonas sp. UBA4487]
MKIGFFGDSFTHGVGDPTGKGWVGRLCDATGLDYEKFGVPGDTSEGVMNRWQAQAEGFGFDRLVFMIGSNDALLNEHRRVTINEVNRLKNAKAIMMAARAVAPTLFVSALPVVDDAPASGRIGDMARQMGMIARINKVAYLDIFADVAASDVWRTEAMANDGAHPGEGGYQLVADLIAGHTVWQDFIEG